MRRIIYALCLFFAFSLYSSGFTLDDVVKALERNSSHLKDMSCEVVVETDLGNEVKVQRMRLWSKGEKLRMEMDGGMCMVMDGERVMMETSQGRSVMPMGFGDSKDALPSGVDVQGRFSEFLRENDARVLSCKGNRVTIELVPREFNPFATRMEMVVDMDRGVVVEQCIYSNYGTSRMEMEYRKVNGVWVISSVKSWVPVPGGKVVKTRIEYRNVKINQGLKDELFYIPEGGNEERK